jgi:hypothetical protein
MCSTAHPRDSSAVTKSAQPSSYVDVVKLSNPLVWMVWLNQDSPMSSRLRSPTGASALTGCFLPWASRLPVPPSGRGQVAAAARPLRLQFEADAREGARGLLKLVSGSMRNRFMKRFLIL